MFERHMIRNALNAAASFIVFLGLALPFIPVPGDNLTRIHVRFLARGMARPRFFTAVTYHSICAVMAPAMAFEDQKTGQFTRITYDG